MRWAIFQDFRGVPYCEPVNEGLQVWTKDIPARKARYTIWGKMTTPAREARRDIKAVFLESHYNRKDYYDSAFEPAPEGYELNQSVVYLQENRWGPVDVLWSTEDDNLGRKLQYYLRRAAPDKSMWVEKRDNNLVPRVGTDRILALVRELAGG